MTTIDTADIYSFGGAEEILGEALEGRRQDFVLVTKAFMRMGTGPHDVGLSRKHLIQACEASLRRLRTDYLDLYICHQPDMLVPIDETLRAYDDLVKQGKVRYVGCSNHSGWHVMKALAASDRHRLARYVCQQVNYSLVARDVEHEIVPLALDQGVGMMAWSPLHAGLLTGKFRRDARPSVSRLNELDAPGTIDYERALPHRRRARWRSRRDRGVTSGPGGAQLGAEQARCRHRHHRRARRGAAARQPRRGGVAAVRPRRWRGSTRSARCRSRTRCGTSTSSASSGIRRCRRDARSVRL